jgi:signal transduction histidine kinase
MLFPHRQNRLIDRQMIPSQRSVADSPDRNGPCDLLQRRTVYVLLTRLPVFLDTRLPFSYSSSTKRQNLVKDNAYLFPFSWRREQGISPVIFQTAGSGRFSSLMKKRFVLGLAIFTSVFVLGGISLIITIERTTSTLINLIEIHQVEILREQLLANARKIQSDLATSHTRSDETLDSSVENMVQLEKQANKCLECHHNEVITRMLYDVKGQVHAYEEALSRFFTVRSNLTRMEENRTRALAAGYKLVNMLHDMTSLTHARLGKRTQATLVKISNMKTLIFILIILGAVVAIVMAIGFTQGLARPLSVLLQATRKLQSGDLSFRVHGLIDEFGEMAIAFNEMAAALQKQMHNMQRAEQMTMMGEIAAGLVHEMKNPLAGIKGAMQVFQEEADITEEERAILSQAIEEVQRIESLMKNLLNFAKPPKPNLLPVNINDVLEATVSTSIPCSSSAPNSPRAIRSVKHFDPHLPITMVDPLKMQQVFLNLLINAVQAMPSGGTVTVATFENAAANEIQIEIADTGIGINDEIREKIFQPFFTTKNKGTGLGLAISKQLIELHGGTISAEKNAAGGATFRIILPRTEAKEEPLPDQDHRDAGIV